MAGSVLPDCPVVDPPLLSFYGERIEHLDVSIPDALRPEIQEALLRKEFHDFYLRQHPEEEVALVSRDEGSSFEEAVQQTQHFLTQPGIRVIISPAFLWQDLSDQEKKLGVRPGALVRTAEDKPWKMVYFRGSRSVDQDAVNTLALMVYIGQSQGLPIEGAEVSFLSSARIFAGGDDNPASWIESKDFWEDVQQPPPDMEKVRAAHTKKWDDPVHPLRGHVSRLNGHVSKSFQEYLTENRIAHLSQIPDELLAGRGLSPVQKRQVRAVKSGEIVIDDEAVLMKAVEGIFAKGTAPGTHFSFLDFETVTPNLAFIPGSSNRQMLVPQFSCRTFNAERGWEHHQHLYSGDSREPDTLKKMDVEAAQKLLNAVGDSGPILVWNQPTEIGVIRELAKRLRRHGHGSGELVEPSPCSLLAEKLEKILNDNRIVDLFRLVKNHLYAEGFGGSFSLKNVLGLRVSEWVIFSQFRSP